MFNKFEVTSSALRLEKWVRLPHNKCHAHRCEQLRSFKSMKEQVITCRAQRNNALHDDVHPFYGTHQQVPAEAFFDALKDYQ